MSKSDIFVMKCVMPILFPVNYERINLFFVEGDLDPLFHPLYPVTVYSDPVGKKKAIYRASNKAKLPCRTLGKPHGSSFIVYLSNLISTSECVQVSS